MTVTRTFSPPRAARKQSTLPSPPSATGMDTTWQSGKCSATLPPMISQIRAEDRVPLKESGIRTTFFISLPPDAKRLPPRAGRGREFSVCA